MLPPLNDIYRGRSVFVTGGTGFLGQVLVEKLLYSLSTINHIYILIRGAKNKTPEERWKQITEGILYNRIRRECPERLSKVVLVHGDITMQNLGLSPTDMQKMIDEVSVVFHCAATIRFTDHLKSAVESNVNAVSRVISLCHRLPKLVSFLHCSTAYSNCDKSYVEEKVYPLSIDVHKLIETVEWMDRPLVDQITPTIVGKKLNTYCFTKALAENLLMDEEQNLPVIIFRPSIVFGIWRDGIPGWVEGLHGVAAITFAMLNGAVSCVGERAELVADYIPVDIVSNMMITAAAYRSTIKEKTIPVLHCSSRALNGGESGMFADVLNHSFNECPMERTLGIPRTRTGSVDWEKWTLQMKRDFVGPAMDAVMSIKGDKPFFERAYSQTFDLIEVLAPILEARWTFESKGLLMLLEIMNPEDKETFNFDIRQVDWADCGFDFIMGVRRFIGKQDPFDERKVVAAKRRIVRLRIFRRVLVLVACFLIAMLGTRSLIPWMLFIPLAVLAQVLITEASPGKYKTLATYKEQQKKALLGKVPHSS